MTEIPKRSRLRAVIILCALAPWTVLLLPRLLVPNWL